MDYLKTFLKFIFFSSNLSLLVLSWGMTLWPCLLDIYSSLENLTGKVPSHLGNHQLLAKMCIDKKKANLNLIYI